MANPKDILYPEHFAGGYSSVDSTVQFYGRIRALLRGNHRVLDLGAGRGAFFFDDKIEYRRALRLFRGHCAEVIGCDVDPAVLQNPSLDRAFLIHESGRLDLEDESVDIVFADWVFEHIADPDLLATELQRVLKPGGWVCARTPNRFGYISVGARFIPASLHGRVLKFLQPNRQEIDIFPTFYRLNSKSALKKAFPTHNWHHFSYFWNAEPAYFRSSLLAWRFAKIFQKFLPDRAATTLMVFLQKK